MDGPYCTVANVKTLLEKKPGTVRDDGLLQLLADGASRAARTFIGTDILQETLTEYRNGTGTGALVLRRRPVSAVAYVKIGAPGTTRALLSVNRDYVWDEFSILAVDGTTFPRGVQNIEIQYTAGFADVPADVREKVAKMAAVRFRELDRLGETSKSQGGTTVNFETKDLPEDVRLVLEQYRSRTPV